MGVLTVIILPVLLTVVATEAGQGAAKAGKLGAAEAGQGAAEAKKFQEQAEEPPLSHIPDTIKAMLSEGKPNSKGMPMQRRNFTGPSRNLAAGSRQAAAQAPVQDYDVTGVPARDSLGSPLDPARDPVAALPEFKNQSARAPYCIPHGSRQETDRAPDGRRTLGFMTPAGIYTENMPSRPRFTCDSSLSQRLNIMIEARLTNSED
ncbi:hypothetical protein Bbelb_160570 [Branchiostoma belcheri]|nr:hypothetical protein Bbelb_160570 [Branchiostoma belcheri]